MLAARGRGGVGCSALRGAINHDEPLTTCTIATCWPARHQAARVLAIFTKGWSEQAQRKQIPETPGAVSSQATMTRAARKPRFRAPRCTSLHLVARERRCDPAPG